MLHDRPLAPGLLLAAPPLGDPNFARAVVLLASHSEQGALGWVVNGAEIASVSQLLRHAGLIPESTTLPDSSSYASKARIGGPVSPSSAWFLYRRQDCWAHDREILLSDHWAASADRSIIEAIARGAGPCEFRMVLGYAGWGPGQLDQEIGAGAWMPAALDEDLLFGFGGENMWIEAYQRLIGVTPFAFTGMRPGSA